MILEIWRLGFDMDQLSRNMSGSADASDTESLPYSVDVSDTDSVVESVGSARDSWKPPTPNRRPGGRFRRAKRGGAENSGTQFIQFRIEMRDVPVHAAWEFIRDHSLMVRLVPGIMDCFYYLEGDGGSGSVFLGNYTPRCVKPGEDKYLINKVEVRDDVSKFYAVRCVGGKYLKRYSVYFTFMKVLPDEIRGDSSSIVAVRLEYQLRNPDAIPPLESKYSYTTVLNLIRDRHILHNRVERPILAVKVAKRLRLLASQLPVGVDDEQGSDDSMERRRKSRFKLLINNNAQARGKPPMRKAVLMEAGDDGMVFARRAS